MQISKTYNSTSGFTKVSSSQIIDFTGFTDVNGNSFVFDNLIGIWQKSTNKRFFNSADNQTFGSISGSQITITDTTFSSVVASDITVDYDNGKNSVTTNGTIFTFSSVNSTTAQLGAGATFTGSVESIIDQQSFSILFFSDLNATITINQFIDAGGTKSCQQNVFTYTANGRFARSFAANGNFVQLIVQNTGGSTTTTLQLNTAYGTIPSSTQLGNSPMALNEVNGSSFSLGQKTSANSLPAVIASDQILPTISQGQSRFRTTFAKTLASTVDSTFFTNISNATTSAGQTVSQSSGNLVITTGTTLRSELILRSVQSFTGSFLLKVKNILGSRSSNNNFFIELVDVIGDNLAYNITSATTIVVTIPSNPFTSENIGQSIYIGNFLGTGTFLGARVPIASVSGNDVTFTVSAFTTGTGTCSLFGWNYHQISYLGATATNANYDTQRRGWNSGSAAVTVNTTNSPGHLAVMGSNDGNSFFADQLVASSNTLQLTPRATRVENIAEENTPLFIQIRTLNNATAPSAITWTIGMLSMETFIPQPVQINDLRPSSPNGIFDVNLLRIGQNTLNNTSNQASTNRQLGVYVGGVSNSTITTTAYAGNGSTLGAVQVVTDGGGVSMSFNIQVTTLTLGTATAVLFVLQESYDNGTTYTDIWVTEPITATGNYRIPLLPIGGRIRFRAWSVSGTSTTVTTVINVMESSGIALVQKQYREIFAATNPFNSMINGTLVATTFVLATLNSTTAVANIEGCKVITASLVLTGSPTVTVQPTVTLQISQDATNWFNTTAIITGAGNGTYMATLSTFSARFARLIVTTAATFSVGSYTISAIGINGTN